MHNEVKLIMSYSDFTLESFSSGFSTPASGMMPFSSRSESLIRHRGFVRSALTKGRTLLSPVKRPEESSSSCRSSSPAARLPVYDL